MNIEENIGIRVSQPKSQSKCITNEQELSTTPKPEKIERKPKPNHKVGDWMVNDFQLFLNLHARGSSGLFQFGLQDLVYVYLFCFKNIYVTEVKSPNE
jgi:hypothetical protein